MTVEEWRVIPGFEDYKASSLGRIKRIHRIEKSIFGPAKEVDGEFLIPTVHGTGYLVIGLYVGTRQYQKGLHQFIMLAFIGPPPDGQQTLHADGVKTNCKLSNLSYGTALENAMDRDKHGTTAIGMRNGNSKLTDTEVLAIRKYKDENNCTYAAMAPLFKVSPEMISLI